MTDLDIIKMVYDTLDGISVPVLLTDQIAVPIRDCSKVLKNLYNTVTEKLKNAEKQVPETTPEEVVQDGNE